MAYLLLAVVGMLSAAYTLWRTEHKARVLALVVVATAVIVLADWVAFGWLYLYSYDTGFPLTERANDALGEVLADIAFVPPFTVLLIRFLPLFRGLVVGTVLYSALQWLFEWLGLYIDRGWEVWHTALAFPFYFGALYWYQRHLQEPNWRTGWQAKLLLVCLMFDGVALLTLFLRAGGLVHTAIHIMPTYIGNQSLGRFLTYAMGIVPVGYWIAGHHGAARWIRLGAVLALYLGLNAVMEWTGFQQFRYYWTGPLDAVVQTAVILLCALAHDGILALARREDRWTPPVLPRGSGTR